MNENENMNENINDNDNIERKLTKEEIKDFKRFIDKLHLRTFDKIYKHVHKQYPDIPKHTIRSIVNDRVKDPNNIRKVQRKYMNKLFSNHIHNYQMDLLDNGNDITPRYWYIFINVNTKYVHVYPLVNKSSDKIIKVLKHFIKDVINVSSLTGDAERGWCSDQCIDYLKSSKITLRVIHDKQHTALSVIDRFIRTLRDMNIPSDKNTKHRYSNNIKYHTFTQKRMNKLIDTYNKTYHREINMKPSEMKDNVELEIDYIRKCLNKQTDIEETNGYNLRDDEYVRVLLDKQTFKKHRYRVSREYYKVSGRDGKLYLIMSEDGSVKLFPRWKLISIGMNKPKNMLMCKSFDDNVVIREIERIKRFGPTPKTYVAVFKYPDGHKEDDVIESRSLSSKYPQIITRIEKEFLDKQK